jgi:hypothetical protein
MSTGRGVNDQQATFSRQATILRKNLIEWDAMLHNSRGEDYPTMLGRLNAAFHQTASMDRSIDDVLEHFVYVPKKCTANAQDIPFFLSTRLESSVDELASLKDDQINAMADPIDGLAKFERTGARIASEYEGKMVRF